MKLAIIGSRSITDSVTVLKAVDEYVNELKPSVILMGAAKGIDPVVAHYAKSHQIDIVEFVPYHLIDSTVPFDSKYFFIRTKQLLNNADVLLAFWDKQSKGTEYAIKYAQKLELEVHVIKLPQSKD
jgi:hypothetical protein